MYLHVASIARACADQAHGGLVVRKPRLHATLPGSPTCCPAYCACANTAAGGGYDDDDDVGDDGGYDGGWGDLGDMLLAGDGEGLEMVQASSTAGVAAGFPGSVSSHGTWEALHQLPCPARIMHLLPKQVNPDVLHSFCCPHSSPASTSFCSLACLSQAPANPCCSCFPAGRPQG